MPEEPRYETTDVPTKPLFIFFAAFTAFLVVSSLVMGGLYLGISSFGMRRMPVWNQPETLPTPAAPRLQADELSDLPRLRHDEDVLLTGYGWTEPGFARVPLDRAESLVLTQKLIAEQKP